MYYMMIFVIILEGFVGDTKSRLPNRSRPTNDHYAVNQLLR